MQKYIRATRRSFGEKSKFSWFFWLKWGSILAAFAFVLGGIAFFILLGWSANDLPNPDKIIDREVAQSTKIYDRTGQTLLYEIHGNQKRTIISLDQIPDHVKWATIAAEDRHFYEHQGFSLLGILRSVVVNTLSGTKKQGGSTITQQLVKNAILTNEKTYTRKMKELLLSYQIENKFSKDQILKMYLNEIPYGSTAYGIQAASQTYFGKDVKDLTVAQAATIAAVANAPTYYSPYGENRDKLMARKDYVINGMVEIGHLTKEEGEIAKKEEIIFKTKRESIIAPHFVMYIKGMLTEKYGEQMVEQGGLTVITTLDVNAQHAGEEAIQEFAATNEKNYQASNAALVAIDPHTGQVLAMVGSRDYFDETIDGNVNVATRARQPGSSFKPLVYATLFDKGFTANTILYDVETVFKTDNGTDYNPHNFDLSEDGPLTIRKALAGSKNIPAVKALYLAGMDSVLANTDKLGYTTLDDRSRFGLSVVLGGGEVKLLEHTAAYGSFSQDGMYHPYASILSVKDANGRTLEQFKDSEVQVYTQKSAQQINDILSDSAAREYVFGKDRNLMLPDRPVAVKTGTTNNYHDAWTMGYTPSLVAGVWAGNNDNKAMNKAGGTKAAAPIWHSFMAKMTKGTPVEYFVSPGDLTTGKNILDGKEEETRVMVDKVSGKLATDSTPVELREERIYKTAHTILQTIDPNDPLGEAPKNPQKDMQYQNWENAIQTWLQKNNIQTIQPPTEYDDIHLIGNTPSVTIVSPGSMTTLSGPFDVHIQSQATRGVRRVEFYIDNILLGTANTFPFDGTSLPLHGITNGQHTLSVRAYDDVENMGKTDVTVNISASLPPEISILTPKENMNFSDTDFPLVMSLNAFGGTQQNATVKRVTLYYYEGSNPKLIASSSNPADTRIDMVMTEFPGREGEYKLFAEMELDNGQTYESKVIHIQIKKTQ